MGQECSICIQHGAYFLNSLIFHGCTNFLIKSWPPFKWVNFYVMGKKYMLSLQCAFRVLGNRVESSKITSYLELFWTKYFHFGWQNVSTYFSTFVKSDWHIIHKFYWILTLTKHLPKEKCSDGKEFRIFKLKLAYLKVTEAGSTSFLTRRV